MVLAEVDAAVTRRRGRWVAVRRADFRLGDFFPLPAKTTVLISQFRYASRWRGFFPDPLRFDPERFTPEARARRMKFTYFFVWRGRAAVHWGVVFGYGRRAIAGFDCTEVGSWAWCRGIALEPEPLITLRPKYGMRMLVESRAS